MTNQEANIEFYKNHYQDVVMSSYGRDKIMRATDKKDRPVLLVWQGKQKNPYSHYYYNSLERREEKIAEIKKIEDMIAERKAEQKAERSKAPEFEVGDIFSDSWGYDQTNVDFYECIEKPSAHYGIFREIGADRVEGSEGHDCCQLVPAPGRYLDGRKGEPMRLKVQFQYGAVRIKTRSYSHAAKTDPTESHYCSWYR